MKIVKKINSKTKRTLKLRGILVPSANKLEMGPAYQLICGNGRKYLIKSDSLWNGQLKRLSWEHVIVGGIYNADFNALELLYIYRDKRTIDRDAYVDSYYEDDRDILDIRHQIDYNGFIQPAA